MTTAATNSEIIISADSHVMEPHDLWTSTLSARFGDRAPAFAPSVVGQGFQHAPGGTDPNERLKEMAQDPGLSAEVLYPTRGLSLFNIEDKELQEACFRVYNDWLIDYCRVAGERLLGVALISCYDIDQAVAEVRRCRNAGLRGAEIWQVPHASLPFSDERYEPLWSVLEELAMPLSLHILTGFGGHTNRRAGIEYHRTPVNYKILDATNAIFDFVYYGILDRHPALNLVTVENEIGWLPFYTQQWDYYWRRFQNRFPTPIANRPGFYIERQVYATFFNDTVGGHNLGWWGQDTCMWSNDYPHENTTWPNSYKIIQRDLGHLPDDVRERLVRGNVTRLYNLKVPALAQS